MSQPLMSPTPGCIVEFLEDNEPRIALALEESGGKSRLLLPNRRELKLSSSRFLPWLGPVYPASLSREEAIKILESHRDARLAKASQISPIEAWELAQGEISQAPASWFAELFENSPDPDSVAAFGRALLACKTHFRFQPPEFLVYDAETVAKRLEEKTLREQKEALVAGGSSFLRYLWEIASKKRSAPDSFSGLLPEKDIAARLEKMLYSRMINPESQEDDNLWQQISRDIPDSPNAPLQLLIAWGKLPEHFNFWLERAGYETGDSWWLDEAEKVKELEAAGNCETGAASALLPKNPAPFISIDSASTRDIDDAFHIEKLEEGWRVIIALACPALNWPFGEELDKKVRSRATSVYLPEGDCHMLPEPLGVGAFSLFAGKERPALCVELILNERGVPIQCSPSLARVELAANLSFTDVQKALENQAGSVENNPALARKDILALASEWAKIRETRRIEQGAVILPRPDPGVIIKGEGENIVVDIEPEEPYPDAQRMVAELMVLASSALADWAVENNIPLIFRTQQAAIPKEFAGVWENPADQARIMRAMTPSMLEIAPAPHAALGVKRYAPTTSPLRRYADLLNEAQILRYLETGKPLWSADELSGILASFSPNLDAATRVQKFRPRYWKLVYFKQKGDKIWWDGVISEENENYAAIAMPVWGMAARGRRELFDERAAAGAPVQARLGKIHPLDNEIQILETRQAE